MVLKQWPMHTLIGKHTHACKVLQTHMRLIYTLTTRLLLIRSVSDGNTRKHTVDKHRHASGEYVCTFCFHCTD